MLDRGSNVRSALLAVCLAAAGAAQEPPVAPPATTLVEGRVVDMRGEGVPAARIRVTGREVEQELAHGVADGEGYFRIPRVQPAAWYRVMASSEGRCTGTAYIRPPSTSCLVTVHDAATVRGVLRDRQGEPVGGAIVRAEPRMRSLWGVSVDATTDRDGRFELRDVPLGYITIGAIVPGEGFARVESIVAGDTEVALTPSLEATTTLRIVVTGIPEAAAASLGCMLLPYRDGSLQRFPPPWDRPAFGADGVCELAPVPEQVEYMVRPGAEGFVFEPRELRTEAEGPFELHFVARPAGATDLRCPIELRDSAGASLAGVKLVMRASNGGQQAEVVTDAEGRALFDSPLGVGSEAVVFSADERWVLDPPASAPNGLRDRRSAAWHPFVVEPDRTIELRAIRACTVAGRLVSADGRPAAFVRIECEGDDARRWPRWMAFAYGETDREGRYRFRNLHHDADAVRVRVEGPQGTATSEPFVLAEPGTSVEVPELRLSPAASIAGVVVDAEGRPAPGVRVWLRDWDMDRNRQRSGSIVEVVTDRAGRYRFAGVPSGGAWLQLQIENEHTRDRAVEPFEVEPGRTYTHDLELPAR